jgi:ketosteroid isomerase-like protein
MAHQEQSPEIDLLNRFNAAFNRHDVDAIMSMMSEDAVFDNTSPAPDGTMFQGQANVRQFWEEFFAHSKHARFETEEMFAYGDRAFQRWIYTWIDAQGVSGHVRGVDIFRFRDGLIVEKLSYVKG